MALLEVKNVGFAYGRQRVLREISFAADSGEMLCLLGRNGAGKSTLFDVLLGLHRDYDGEVLADGRPLRRLSRGDIAALMAYVPQSHAPTFNYTALDIVLMGISHELRAFSAPKEAHRARARAALERLSAGYLADKGYRQISGGERQLVLIARALAQESKILLFDEPAANLDFGNQARLLQTMRELARQGYLVIFSSHQPDHALLYADRALVLHENAAHACGPVREVLTPALLGEIYGVSVEIRELDTPEGIHSVCLPLMGSNKTEKGDWYD